MASRKRAKAADDDEVRVAVELVCQRPLLSCQEALAALPKSLTPLERQVVGMREQLEPYVMLLVTCGYRIKFYGRDSRTASRRLGIMCIPTTPFESSSVPYIRGDLYVTRLVSMGYHVAFADQQESAALRQTDGGGARGVFKRSVSRIYCRSTLLPGERVTLHSTVGAGAAATKLSDSSAAVAEDGGAGNDDDADGPEGGSEGAETKEGEFAVDVPSADGGSRGESSDLYMLFLREVHRSCAVTGSPKTEGDSVIPGPYLEGCLVSFLRSRLSLFRAESELELEDILRSHTIADVVVFVNHECANELGKGGAVPSTNHLSLSRPFARTLELALPLNYGPSDHGSEDNCNVSAVLSLARPPSGPGCPVPSLEEAIRAFLVPYGVADVFDRLVLAERHHSVEVPAGASSAAPEVGAAGRRGAVAVAGTKAVPLEMPGTTLRALDVFSSTHSGASAACGRGAEGSLLWLLDQSVTAMGARQLRSWLASPLASVTCIRARQGAVNSLLRGVDGGGCLMLLKECSAFGDQEAVFARLQTQRGTVAEYIRLLRMVDVAHRSVVQVRARLQKQATSDALGGGLLHHLCDQLAGDNVRSFLADHKEEVTSVASTPLELFTTRSKCDEGGSVSGANCPAEIAELLMAEASAIQKLQVELQAVRQELGMNDLEFKTISGTPFVIDVPQGCAKRAPSSWTVLTRTKANVRFHTPRIADLNVELCATRERMAIAAREHWLRLQLALTGRSTVADAGVDEAKDNPCSLDSPLAVARSVVAAVGEIDALASLARLASSPGYSCPEVTEDAAAIVLEGARHPVLERRMCDEGDRAYVACDVTITRGGAWILTGPNMGGKSALMRMVGCIVVLAQIGSFVPAKRATLPLFAAIFCRMGAQDAILEGASTFLTEMHETSRILRSPLLSQSLVLMDELGRGTSSYDGIAVAAATLQFLRGNKATTIFVTHYSVLCEPYRHGRCPNVECYFMGFTDHGASDSQPGGESRARSITFTYRPCPGVTPSSFGVEVASMAGLPSLVTQRAAAMSEREERAQQQRESYSILSAFMKPRG